ncbi:MAG: Hpt domain-containing protein [Chloroflexi bacterium]|uniref:Hpt domain-containing protein n=1 Tax=Candidatus Chlorohelix allophototropha TaxID=3003348 RepID=A0A8T7M5X7_9CHLR|nr:Hpt domain-containing protein [Chloroflexota bacterium]WJW69419.1 Hpt domain-containing protein [Chloroflexota bacterium L227-S17]
MSVPPTSLKWVLRFKQEAAAHLQLLEQGLRQVQPNIPSQPVENTDQLTALNPELREFFRLGHTIKGSAAMVGLQEIADKAERLENSLHKVFKRPNLFSELKRQRLLALVAELTREVDEIGKG